MFTPYVPVVYFVSGSGGWDDRCALPEADVVTIEA
jgi:hypothetical protein